MKNYRKTQSAAAWLLVLVLIVFAAFGAYAEENMPTADDALIEEDVGEASMLEEVEGEFAGVEETEAVAAEGEIMSGAENDVLNILIIGTDERGSEFSADARGDACMILSVNKNTGKMKVVSFERAMGVPILSGANEGKWDWLTHTFKYGGAELMVKEISENFKVDVQYYVRVNLRTFMKLIDLIGGVDIDLTGAEVKYINAGFGRVTAAELGVEGQLNRVEKGVNRLNGATALVYARCRKIDSDWRRIERQRTVMMAVLAEFMKLEPAERAATAISLVENVETNITLPDFRVLAEYLAPLMSGEAEGMTIPVKGSYGSRKGMGGRSMFSANFETNSKALQAFLYGE